LVYFCPLLARHHGVAILFNRSDLIVLPSFIKLISGSLIGATKGAHLSQVWDPETQTDV
jgi:hypothetical protein